MPKISAYPINPDETAEAIIQIGSANYRVSLAELLASAITTALQVGAYVWDFLSSPTTFGVDDNQPYPWVVANIGAGIVQSIAGEENHPGIVKVTQSGANTGSGFWLGHGADVLLAGEEETELVFQVLTLTSVIMHFGFSDTLNSVSATVDGAFCYISAGVFGGACAKNSVQSLTATTYTLSINTWYRGKVVVDPTAARVDFYLYDESGNLLWSDFVTANIPTAVGRETSHGYHIYKTTAGSLDLAYFDYISLYMPKTLVR